VNAKKQPGNEEPGRRATSRDKFRQPKTSQDTHLKKMRIEKRPREQRCNATFCLSAIVSRLDLTSFSGEAYS
jgi:hypothetical protein